MSLSYSAVENLTGEISITDGHKKLFLLDYATFYLFPSLSAHVQGKITFPAPGQQLNNYK